MDQSLLMSSTIVLALQIAAAIKKIKEKKKTPRV